jgi:SAM-dependent methyltransferase
MSVAKRLKRLFVFDPPDPVGFWRSRAGERGTLSVMWLNEAYNERAHEDQWRAIERNLPAGRDAVLDLGCGTGRLAARLSSLFERYVGVDLDTMVAEAKRRNPDVAAEFVVSKVQEYDFPAESFDMVLSMACLGNACYADEIAHMAEGMVRATRNGGTILLVDAFHTIPVLTRICRMRPEEVIATFERFGVELVEWTGIHFIPVRFLVARPQFAAMRSLVHAAYGLGEAALALAPRRFGDYSVIAFRK